MRELPVGNADRLLYELNRRPWMAFRYLLINQWLPSVDRQRTRIEILLGERDGIEAGLALEAYRRVHGEFPQSLSQLVPQLLPVVPIDRITGDPVKYRLIAGKPVVYSVGADRLDNGGEPPQAQIANRPVATWHDPTDQDWKPAAGDWILYPLPKADD